MQVLYFSKPDRNKALLHSIYPMAIQGHPFWKMWLEYIVSKEKKETNNHEDLLFHKMLPSKLKIKR